MSVARALIELFPQDRFLVNHDIMHCTADGVQGNHLYSGRALGITGPQDLIQMHPELVSQWDAICAHYDRIGLEHTSQAVWNVALHDQARYPGFTPSVFFFGEHEHKAFPDENWYQAVRFINSKNNFTGLANYLRVPVPRTFCFDDVSRVPEILIQGLPYPCYLKASISVSGVGIYRCGTPQELRGKLTCFTPGTPVQIQEEVDTSVFLNLQYRVDGAHLEQVAATEQVLDGYAHQGNRYPARYDAWSAVQPMAEWLFSYGMKGIFAFDVAVVEGARDPQFLAIECNPRFNGASYPTLIAAKLGISQWVAIEFYTRFNTLGNIDLSGIEYDLATQTGVVLVNWGPVLAGKLMCLLAGPVEMQNVLRMELNRRIC